MDSNHLVRGILIGGSLGIFASLVGIVHMREGFVLGGLAGLFAGITMARRAEKRKASQRPASSAPNEGDAE